MTRSFTYIITLLFAIFCLASALPLQADTDADHQYWPDDSDTPCTSDAECRGADAAAPLEERDDHRPNRPHHQFSTVNTTICGKHVNTFLPEGRYNVMLGAATGGRGIHGGIGGPGAIVTATFDVSKDITVGYFLGCAGATASEGVGGGGGGSFIFTQGHRSPAVLVAGGGGGAGRLVTMNGRPGGITFDGTATLATGAPGARDGKGGAVPPVAVHGPRRTAGAGGAGFTEDGEDVRHEATGGSRSYNFGGSFAGGVSFVGPNNLKAQTGGLGGGGGAGSTGGGGGGGYSGGGGGAGQGSIGGGGGGSYANQRHPGGIRVNPTYATAINRGNGYLIITRAK